MLTLLELLRTIMTEMPPDDPPGGDDPPAVTDPPVVTDPPDGDDPPGGDDPPDGEPDEEQKVPISDLKKIRAEAAKYRTSLRASEAENEKMKKAQAKADKDAEIAKLGEIEQHQARATEAEKATAEAEDRVMAMAAKLQANAVSQAVYRAANAAGFLHPEDAIRYIDASKIEVVDDKVDDDLISEMITTLAESRPNLIRAEEEESNEFGGGSTNPAPREQAPGPKLTSAKVIQRMRDDLEVDKKANKVSGQEIAKRRRAIREAQSGASVRKERGG